MQAAAQLWEQVCTLSARLGLRFCSPAACCAMYQVPHLDPHAKAVLLFIPTFTPAIAPLCSQFGAAMGLSDNERTSEIARRIEASLHSKQAGEVRGCGAVWSGAVGGVMGELSGPCN